MRKPSETPGENDWPGYFTITIKSNDCSHPSNICKRPWYPIAVAFQINFVVFLLQENFYILKWRHYLLLKMLVRVDSSCCCPMNERVWPSLLGGKLTIFKIPFKKTLLATLIVTDHPKNFIDISLLVWVNTSSRMVWLTKIK